MPLVGAAGTFAGLHRLDARRERDVARVACRAVHDDLLQRPSVAQRRMVVGAAAERPVVFALALLDRKIVDAGDAQAHQAVLVEFPVLVAVAAEPVAAVVVPLIGEAHGDAVVAERPDFLDQAVVELAVPFARQERLDGLATLEELGAVPPAAVGRVGERNARRIARIPGVLGHARLLRGGLGGERGKRRTARRAHGYRSSIAVSDPPPARPCPPAGGIWNSGIRPPCGR